MMTRYAQPVFWWVVGAGAGLAVAALMLLVVYLLACLVLGTIRRGAMRDAEARRRAGGVN